MLDIITSLASSKRRWDEHIRLHGEPDPNSNTGRQYAQFQRRLTEWKNRCYHLRRPRLWIGDRTRSQISTTEYRVAR